MRILLNKWSNYLTLIKNLNCALATLRSVQKTSGDLDDEVLRAAGGLEGGCAACGLTCGVATGGALGIGLMNEDFLLQGIKEEMTLVEMVRDYMDWFQKTHGSSLCRERTGVDFHTALGQFLYLFPGTKVARCAGMTGRTLNHLIHGRALLPPRKEVEDILGEVSEIKHCARYVLEKIRMKTGLGNSRLERLAVVFDGGVGLKGEVCGGCAGAIMAINLSYGFNVRSVSFLENVGRFVRGHINLIRKIPRNKKEVFATGKQFVTQFTDRFGTMRCSDLCGLTFSNSGEFIDHITQSSRCSEILDFAADQAVQLMKMQ